MGAPFRNRLRVRYHECDAQGVVFNANYFAYFDVTLTELWREAFGSYAAMVEGGTDVVVAEARARFLSPARFDEEIDVVCSIDRLGTTSMVIRLDVVRGAEQLIEGHMRYVFVEAGTTAKRAIPDDTRRVLERYAS
jgi:acyl-CoA thioester hydrolase